MQPALSAFSHDVCAVFILSPKILSHINSRCHAVLFGLCRQYLIGVLTISCTYFLNPIYCSFSISTLLRRRSRECLIYWIFSLFNCLSTWSSGYGRAPHDFLHHWSGAPRVQTTQSGVGKCLLGGITIEYVERLIIPNVQIFGTMKISSKYTFEW